MHSRVYLTIFSTAIAVGILSFLGVYIAGSQILSAEARTAFTAQAAETLGITAVQPEPAVETIAIAPSDIYAQTAIVLSVKTGSVLFEKQKDKQVPLASLTKLMTALVSSQVLQDSDVITISDTALSEYGSSGLISQERWRAADLRDYMLITSSNDAASAFAEAAGGELSTTPISTKAKHALFVEEMNSVAKKIGLTDTYFIDETGLDTNADSAGAYGTAYDVGRLMTYMYKNNPALIESTTNTYQVFTSLSGYTHYGENTNESIPEISNLIGGKTGFTYLAGGNLAVMFDRGINDPIIVVVLGSTRQHRFDDVVRLVRAVMK